MGAASVVVFNSSLLCSRAFSLSLLSFPSPRNSTGRAGVPMEVMGLMLGEFVDDYTIRVADVFAMPQVRLFSSPSSMENERERKTSTSTLAGKKLTSFFPQKNSKQNLTVRHGRLRRGGGPGLPDEDARHAPPGWPPRDGEGRERESFFAFCGSFFFCINFFLLFLPFFSFSRARFSPLLFFLAFALGLLLRRGTGGA